MAARGVACCPKDYACGQSESLDSVCELCQQHARVVKAECKAEVHTWLEGEKVSASFDTWTDLAGDTLVVVCSNQFYLTFARSDKISFAFG